MSNLNDAFLTAIAGEVQLTPGVIRVSTLGGCLLHKAYAASTRTAEDVVEEKWSPLPAYLGKAYEKAIAYSIWNGEVPGVEWIPPPHEDGCQFEVIGMDPRFLGIDLVAGIHCDCQWKVVGDSYGMPAIKGHQDGKVRVTHGGLGLIAQALLEIKLLSPWSFRTFVQGEYVKGRQKTNPGIHNFPEYEMQIQVYMGLSGLPACLFHMGTSYFKLIEKYGIEQPTATEIIPFDEAIFNRAINRAEEVQDALLSGRAPQCEKMRWCP